MYDTFLNGALYGTINQFEFPQMLSDSIISNLSYLKKVSMNYFKEGFQNDKFGYGYHNYNHWQELKRKIFRLPWKPLPTDTVYSLISITRLLERAKVETIMKFLSLLTEQIIQNHERNIFEK